MAQKSLILLLVFLFAFCFLYTAKITKKSTNDIQVRMDKSNYEGKAVYITGLDNRQGEGPLELTSYNKYICKCQRSLSGDVNWKLVEESAGAVWKDSYKAQINVEFKVPNGKTEDIDNKSVESSDEKINKDSDTAQIGVNLTVPAGQGVKLWVNPEGTTYNFNFYKSGSPEKVLGSGSWTNITYLKMTPEYY